MMFYDGWLAFRLVPNTSRSKKDKMKKSKSKKMNEEKCVSVHDDA